MTTGTPRGRVYFAAENGSGAPIRGLPELARGEWTCPEGPSEPARARDSL
jgi:hypothetical protein